MTVKTKSGSIYLFSIFDGKFHVMDGTREYVLPKLPEIEIGKPLEFTGFQLNPYTYTKATSETFFKSTPVVEVLM